MKRGSNSFHLNIDKFLRAAIFSTPTDNRFCKPLLRNVVKWSDTFDETCTFDYSCF